MRIKSVVFGVCIFFLLCSFTLALVGFHDGGTWPEDWPEELDHLRKQARTLNIMTGIQETIYEIPFSDRKEFESAWLHILKLKSKNGKITLLRSRSKRIGETMNASVRILYPSMGESVTPEGKRLKPGPPWPKYIRATDGSLPEYVTNENGKWVPCDIEEGEDPGSRRGFLNRARIDIELVVDGNIVDLKRISIPDGTPIIDKLFEKKKVEKEPVAWGEAVQGLQLGIHVPATCPVGEPLHSASYIRNASTRPIEFSFYNPTASSPLFQDASGAMIMTSGSIFSFPVVLEEERLEPGESTQLPGPRSCILSPHLPVWFCGENGFRGDLAPTPPGKYQVSWAFQVTLLNGKSEELHLVTGQADLVVLPPDKKVFSERGASELRKEADRFNLKIVRHAQGDSPLRSLQLTVLEPKSEYPEFWSTVRISRREAEAIIDYLEQTDYLWRIVAEKYESRTSSDPSYFLSLSLGDQSDPKDLFDLGSVALGWGADMHSRLVEVREAFTGDARKAMDRLLTELEPFRKEWAGAQP